MPVIRKRVALQDGPITVFHDLATTDLLVQLRRTNGDLVHADVEVSNPDYVTVGVDYGYREETGDTEIDVLISY